MSRHLGSGEKSERVGLVAAVGLLCSCSWLRKGVRVAAGDAPYVHLLRIRMGIRCW